MATPDTETSSSSNTPAEAQMKHPLFDLTPGRLLLLVIFAIFLAEGGEMLLLHDVKPPSRFVHLFIDMASMLVVLMPTYFFIFRPFQAQWHERQRMEAELEKSEQRLNYALEAINDGVWDWIVPTGEVYFSPRWQTMIGYEPGELESHYRTWEDHLHPEDKDKAIQVLKEHVDGRTPFFATEYRLRTKSGQYIWIHDRGRVVERDAAGKALRVTGTHTDITRRKQAEAEIHQLWQELDRTAEKERVSLARDLHDHLGQIVTVLQLELGIFKRTLQEPEQVDQFRQIIDLTTSLGHEIRHVTARLRPPALDMGLVPALKYDLEHLHDLQVTLQASGLERQRFEPEVEITLFRIYQEALNNVIKHARAQTVDIRLQQLDGKITMAVQDDGVGFDPDHQHAAGAGSGLGLVGMRERLAALGGQLEISSRPGRGATVLACLPWRPQEQGAANVSAPGRLR
jgi:two-component system, NarL family, sensor histidine kinase UhpB